MSLFTNVLYDLTIADLSKRWEFIKKATRISLNEFLRGVSFVLNSTYFTFGGKFYRQTFGSPMGSPLSLVIVDIVLQDLEEKAIEKIPIHIPFLDTWMILSQ